MYTEMNDEFAFARPYLAPGEAILWRGKPEKGHLLCGQDAFLIPFSMIWCGFAVFWEISVVTMGAPFPMALFGIPFVCVGLYMTVGRFFHTASLRKHTAYVITNQKIIRKRGKKIDMLHTRNLPPVQVTARTDGTGTIRFGDAHYYFHQHDWNGYNRTLFALDNIPDVARVQQILLSIAGS